jgi:hypothetical protein
LHFSEFIFKGVGHPAFDVCVGDVGHSCMLLVNFFDDVCSDEDFSPYDTRLFRERIVASFRSDVYFAFIFLEGDCYIDEVAISNRPETLVLHVVNFEMVLLFAEDSDVDKLRIDLFEGLFLPEELNDLVKRERTDVGALRSIAIQNGHPVLEARVSPILNPILRALEFLYARDNLFTGQF